MKKGHGYCKIVYAYSTHQNVSILVLYQLKLCIMKRL